MNQVRIIYCLGISILSFTASFVVLDSACRNRTKGSAVQGGFQGKVEMLLVAAAGRLSELPLIAHFESREATSKRRQECLQQMSTMLDVVTLGLSAGLSFDGALELYCSGANGLLAEELQKAILSWRFGKTSRSDALAAMSAQLGVAALKRFSAAVTQALAFGSPLAATLEQQACAIRDEQRAEIEEEIERVPVKMLIPLGTLIVPAMLLAILGPLLASSLTLM